MIIYVVEGHCGEYSDRHDWPVHAYTYEAKAKKAVIKLTEWGNEIRTQYKDDRWEWEEYIRELSEEEMAKLLDPHFRWDYSGFNYSYYEVELD
jgi:hypothetical protein